MVQGEDTVCRTAECLQAEAGFTVTYPNKASSSSNFVLNIDNATAQHMYVIELFCISLLPLRPSLKSL
jgi:hypothetical protein